MIEDEHLPMAADLLDVIAATANGAGPNLIVALVEHLDRRHLTTQALAFTLSVAAGLLADRAQAEHVTVLEAMTQIRAHLTTA